MIDDAEKLRSVIVTVGPKLNSYRDRGHAIPDHFGDINNMVVGPLVRDMMAAPKIPSQDYIGTDGSHRHRKFTSLAGGVADGQFFEY